MANEGKEEETIPMEKEQEIKRLNRWLIVLVLFLILWTTSIFIYLKENPSASFIDKPVVVTMVTNNSNLPTLSKRNALNEPLFKQQSTYKVRDFVIINYFYISGIVVDVNQNDNYTIMYKDHLGVIQRVSVPGEMLLVPTSYFVSPLLPASLLPD